MNDNWILFLSDDFTESFRKRLSNGLKKQFDLLVEKDNAIDTYDFQLIIGMRNLDMQKLSENTFINADFVLPTSESLPITIGWKEESDSISLNADASTFFWTSDLPLNRIKQFIK